MGAHGSLHEMEESRVIDRLGVNEFVDAANAETISSSLGTSAIHIISNQQDQLEEISLQD